ncbi:MAG: YggS family pyridoxal phosphate-dependent enzyme [Ruminococcaceae bacterium]|nr:YggS family pyridoxal phosphate-dependent enzyme [Oscillospiraceae bacterium]
MTIKSYNEERFSDISENIKKIRERIALAAEKSGRCAEDISLMAVTKTVDSLFINHAIDSCGINLIGENRVQEFLSKKDGLHLENTEVHLIGHLQTNKVKMIVPHVTMIESVDSVRLAKEISKECEKIGRTMDILVEVNVGMENSKFGIDSVLLAEFLSEIGEISNIRVKGLMAIPPICENSEESRRFFSNMYNMFLDIKGKKIDNIDMQILSMGMSGDYAEAIEEGATEVRVGSSMFGKRVY